MAIKDAENKRTRAAVNKAIAQERAAYKPYKPKSFIRKKAEQAATIGLVGAAGVAALKYQKGKIKSQVNEAIKRGKAAAKKEGTFQKSKAKAAVSQMADQYKTGIKNSAPVKVGTKAIGVTKTQVSKGKARDVAAKSRLKQGWENAKARDAAAKKEFVNKVKAFKPFKKKKNDFSREQTPTLNFAKAKSVSVKGYRRSDGTIVRPSTREIDVYEPPKPTATERARDIGLALAVLAGAAGTGARAYNTVVSANVSQSLSASKIRNDKINTDERKKQIDRDLSALGETRKFLSLAPGVGSTIHSTTSGFNELRGFNTKAKRLERELSIKELGLNIKRDRNSIDRSGLVSKGQIARAMNLNARTKRREENRKLDAYQQRLKNKQG